MSPMQIIIISYQNVDITIKLHELFLSLFAFYILRTLNLTILLLSVRHWSTTTKSLNSTSLNREGGKEERKEGGREGRMKGGRERRLQMNNTPRNQHYVNYLKQGERWADKFLCLFLKWLYFLMKWPNSNSSFHLHALNSTGQNTTTNGDITGKWASCQYSCLL